MRAHADPLRADHVSVSRTPFWRRESFWRIALPIAAGVAVIAAEPGAPEWGEIESRWLEPSLADLRAGRIAHLLLSAGERRFSVSRRGNRR